MNIFKAILLFACVSNLAQADTRTLIADHKSDYLCYFLDFESFRSDEGYAISILPDACVDLSFVEEPYVKHAISCQLDIFATNRSHLVLNCREPQNQSRITFIMNKQTLDATAEIHTTPSDTFKMKCQTNR